jgi:hypothetical protein
LRALDMRSSTNPQDSIPSPLSLTWRAAPETRGSAGVAGAARGAAPEQFPTMRRLFGGLAGTELAADFGFGLDVIIAGLEARANNLAPAG